MSEMTPDRLAEIKARVEAAMAAGRLRAVVCTGSLDLGIDWGDVDLVIQVGAPKNVKRLVQRIGRANHRYNAPSKARIVPANRFEQIECVAALQAVHEGDLDGDPRGPGPLDVLCQHILLTACAAPFDADALFAEVTTAGPYRHLIRADFDACLDFAATGGYALRAYDRWQRLMLRDGLWRLRDPRAVQLLRMNVGTIVEAEIIDAGVAVDAEILVDRAVDTGCDAIAVSTYNGVALGYAKAVLAAMTARGVTLPLLIGGRLNEVPRDSNSGLPVDVTPDLSALGCYPCADMDDMKAALDRITR